MECDKLLKETLENVYIKSYGKVDRVKKPKIKSDSVAESGEGIQFKSKLSDALYETFYNDFPSPSSKVKGKALMAKLKRRGMTQNELDTYGLTDYLSNPGKYGYTDVITHAKTIQSKDLGRQFERITYRERGVDDPTYLEKGFTIKTGKDDLYHPHFSGDMEEGEKLLGWNRTSIGDYKDKKALYLHEFQSDWLQAERQGRGVFKSKVPKDVFTKEKAEELISQIRNKRRELMKDISSSEYQLVTDDLDAVFSKLEKNGLADEVDVLEDFSANINSSRKYSNDLDRIAVIDDYIENVLGKEYTLGEVYGDSAKKWMDKVHKFNGLTNEVESINKKVFKETVIPDFPMKPEKFHQLMIVDAIDRAIKNGLDTIVIPVNREVNNLMGTKGVTKFYDNLNKNVLPAVRGKLAKDGMKIKLTKAAKRKSTKELLKSDERLEVLEYLGEDMERIGILDDIYNFDDFAEAIKKIQGGIDDTIRYYAGGPNSRINPNNIREEIISYLDGEIDSDSIEQFDKIFFKAQNKAKGIIDDGFHEIVITEAKKGSKTRWDIFSVLGALGLTDAYNKLQEHDDADQLK